MCRERQWLSLFAQKQNRPWYLKESKLFYFLAHCKFCFSILISFSSCSSSIHHQLMYGVWVSMTVLQSPLIFIWFPWMKVVWKTLKEVRYEAVHNPSVIRRIYATWREVKISHMRKHLTNSPRGFHLRVHTWYHVNQVVPVPSH